MDDSFPLPPELLVGAYSKGYFPMPDQKTGEIHWYRPDPRAILPLDGFHVSHSLRKTLNKQLYSTTFDTAFNEVMQGCAKRPETWITDVFFTAYRELFRLGIGHSVEVWDKHGTLVGGLYGLSLNGAFFAESKFHTATDASKVALYFLVERLNKQGFQLLEVQFMTEHLKSLGAIELPDSEYILRLKKALSRPIFF